MTSSGISVLLSLVSVVVLGCGEDTPEVCSQPVRFPALSASVLQPYCAECHSSLQQGQARNGAPEALDFDTYEDVEPVAAAVANAITSGSMPPATLPRPDPAERQLAEDWRRCGFLP